jgi:adenosylcobinamide-GDP ribazoletransferase
MKTEIRIFFTALLFYTRIPCPKWVDHSEEYLNKATRYLPLVGIIVGGFSAAIFYGCNFVLPVSVSILFSILGGILMTGAFHEDGMADVCDGFGGGWTKEKILLIMKDSRVGAFGVIGLILLFAFKYSLLVSIHPALVPFVFIAAHALSRLIALTFIFTHTYARNDESGKSTAVAKKPAYSNLIIAAIFGLAPLLLFRNPMVFLIIIPLLLMRAYLGRYFKKWIGGYTGDCLGATQQICEVLFYLCFVILERFIH